MSIPAALIQSRRTGLFLLISLKRTKRDDLYVSFYRPKDKGYAWPLPWAGRYTEGEASERAFNGETVPVPVEYVEAYAVAPRPGYVDGDAGPVLPAGHLNTVLAMVGHPPVQREPLWRVSGHGFTDRTYEAASRRKATHLDYRRGRDAGFFVDGFRAYLAQLVTVTRLRDQEPFYG